ncbi:hypothetical protein [Bacillus licheniformis]|uniref:hypothetical protein n=1 Tax=Bacillus licheniformis TaxID=1402 RepID=UPI002E1F2C7F|nr:hypothetical protein [Bacillus licheniformis]
MEMKVLKMENVFLVTVADVQFMIKAHSNGFQSMVIRKGEPVEVNEVTALEEELLELAHEKLVELMMNELSEKLFPNLDELVSHLDEILNENGFEDVVRAGRNTSKHLN